MRARDANLIYTRKDLPWLLWMMLVFVLSACEVSNPALDGLHILIDCLWHNGCKIMDHNSRGNQPEDVSACGCVVFVGISWLLVLKESCKTDSPTFV